MLTKKTRPRKRSRRRSSNCAIPPNWPNSKKPKKAASHDPSGPVTWAQLGTAQARRGKHKDAAEAFQYVTELQPKDVTAWYKLGVTLRGQQGHQNRSRSPTCAPAARQSRPIGRGRRQAACSRQPVGLINIEAMKVAEFVGISSGVIRPSQRRNSHEFRYPPSTDRHYSILSFHTNKPPGRGRCAARL